MIFRIIPSYKDFFNDEPLSVQDSLTDIDFQTTLSLFTIILAEIENYGEEQVTQDKIWSIISVGFPSSLKIKYDVFRKNKGLEKDKVLFSKYHILEFIQYLVLNLKHKINNDEKVFDDVNMFKAYLLFTDFIEKENEHIFSINMPKQYEEKEIDDFFHQMTWPVILKQHSINKNVNLKYEILKGLLFLQHLKEKYPTFFDNYLKMYQVESHWFLLYFYMSFLQKGLNEKIAFNNRHFE
jgi:hypothetical protein